MTQWRLEFSEDDLSVSNDACTKVDITDLVEVQSLKVAGGYQKLGDPPRAGEMSFVVDGRDFEPLNEDSPYYPNVVRRRRFFLSVLRGATWQPEFVGYARSFQPLFPGNVTEQQIQVVCGDGWDLLTRPMPHLNPPSAETVEDVIQSYGPFGYWTLSDEPTATKAAPVTGPEGVYAFRSKLELGRPGGVVGDSTKAVLFKNVASGTAGRVQIPMAATEYLSDGSSLSVHALVKASTVSAGSMFVIAGPANASGFRIWYLMMNGDSFGYSVLASSGGLESVGGEQAGLGTRDPDVWYSVLWVFDRGDVRLQVNGEIAATGLGTPRSTILTPTSGSPVIIGSDSANDNAGMRGDVAHVALYEHALPVEAGVAIYEAARERGFPQQTAGERITALADHTVWDTSGIDTGEFQVLPRMKHGQSFQSEIEEAQKAEGLRAMTFFNRNGDPEYRGWNGLGVSPFNTVQATFGAPRQTGEIYLAESSLRLDDEFYTEVTHARIGGLAHTESLPDVPEEEQAAAEQVTDLILVSDDDVVQLCGEKLAIYGDLRYVIDELALTSVDEAQEDLIFDLFMGDRLRFKRRVRDSTGALVLAHDIVTHIIGFEWAYGRGGEVSGKWILARGFNAKPGYWQAGVVGFDEAGSTTVAA